MANTLGWQPERTWVFVVGILEWQQSEVYGSFPQKWRRDEALVQFFRDQRVPAPQIVYLQDRAATTERIQESLETLLEAAGPGDLLVLYYCGHGSKSDDGAVHFASYDADSEGNPGWPAKAIPATIERCFHGSHALLLADCCYSGCLGYLVARQERRVAYACLTSSLASELSTGNWTFTEALLVGLTGHAFADGDGNKHITLQELAAQMIDSMAFAEGQVATFTICGEFDPNLVVATARPLAHPDIGRRVEARSGGDWYRAQIIDADGERFKVHYYGYDDSDDEWVTADQMREKPLPLYPVDTRVEVLWRRKWYPATIKNIRNNIHYIQYDDYDEVWNEWVSRRRIRLVEG